jgi:putative DNA primase/helicase
VGIATGAASRIFVLDVDPRHGGEESLDSLIHKYGSLPGTLQVTTGGGGRHFYFKHPGGTVPNEVSILPGLDIRGDGGQVVAPPSLHISGRRYEWDGIDAFNAPIVPAPAWLLDLIRPQKPVGNAPHKIPEIIRDGEKHKTCVSLAGTMRKRGFNGGEIYAALSKLSERFETPVPPENLRMIADDVAGRYAPGEHSSDGRPESAAALRFFPYTDAGNGERLAARFGRDVRYSHPQRMWLVYNGVRWEPDQTGEMFQRAKLLARLLYDEAAQLIDENLRKACAGWARKCESADRLRAALFCAQSEAGIPVLPAELDTHADLLNFTNGTVDLRTGALRPHQRQDFITKMVHYPYRPEATCPTFLAFLKRITANHAGLVGYLQRAFGYSLTGHTIEKAVFLLHGRGDNGKSTLLTAFLKILEEYGVLLQIDTLMVRQESNNTQADLADLRGARFVMTSETEEGQRLAEGKLKRITQGMGRIKATRKYENPVEFPESHKLWIDANHLPIVRGTDNAIWNRLHPVPFDVTIPKDEQDKELPAKLAAEADGILAWAVAGAVRWYSEGLGKPSDVEQAGDAWRAQSDRIGRFITDCCITEDFAQAKARALYSAYRTWGEQGGEHAVTETAFATALQERGFSKTHTRYGAIYSGIGLLAEPKGDGL